MEERQIRAINRAFGLTLRRLREGAGMSQEALAGSSGLDRTYISLLERNLRQPTLKTLVVIASAFELSLSQLATMMESEADAD